MRKQDNEIKDYCFTLNLNEESKSAEYYGLVSLCSTTIQNFMFGVYCGEDAILTCETSSFIALRAGGCAVKSYCPKMLKVMHGTIQKCESHGIQVTLDEVCNVDAASNQANMRKTDGESQQQVTQAGEAAAALSRRRSTGCGSKYEHLTTEPMQDPMEGTNGDGYLAMLSRLTRKVYIENNRIV